MTDTLLHEVRLLRDEVAALHGLVQSLAPSGLPQQQQRLVHALAAVFGASVISSDEVVQALSVPIATRIELADALRACCRGQDLTSKRIGHCLRAIVDAGGTAGQWRIVDAGTEAGSRLWGIEGTASRFARCDGAGAKSD